MSLALAPRMTLLTAAVAALLGLSACGEGERNLTSPEMRNQELVATILRAELPNTNEYTLGVRSRPAPAIDTFANLMLFKATQLARTTDGAFWSVDSTRVVRVDPSGTMSVRASGYQGLRGCAADAAGSLYLSARVPGRVYRMETDSTVTILATGLVQAAQLALSPDESKLYAASSGDDRIVEITLNPLSAGALQTATPVFAPRTLAFDDLGRLYVGSSANSVIVRVDLTVPSPHPVETIAQIPEATVGAMAWSDGSLYVTGGSRIYRIPDGGEVVNFTGSRLPGRSDADPGSLAQFVTPTGMVADAGAGILYVADSGPNSAIRRVLLGQSAESGEWLPEYGDISQYRVVPTAWTFGLDSGERIDIPSFERGASVGSVATGISEDRLSIFGLRDHRVWVQLDVYRFL